MVSIRYISRGLGSTSVLEDMAERKVVEDCAVGERMGGDKGVEWRVEREYVGEGVKPKSWSTIEASESQSLEGYIILRRAKYTDVRYEMCSLLPAILVPMVVALSVVGAL